MKLSDVEACVRQDLFDATAARWSNSDLDRAIDKAVARYSEYSPNIAFADMAAQPYQRTYPYPQSWNPAYPVLWLEKVLYPLQVYGSAFAAPTSAPSVAVQAGSGLGSGQYRYLVTFLSQGGETTAGPSVSVSTTPGNQQVALTNIPLGPVMAGNSVTGRNLYRTAVNGGTFFLLATLPDNGSTTFSDTVSDAALAAQPTPPAVNTSGIMLWPPRERAFAEYSNLYDASSALAAGGNMGPMGASGSVLSPAGSASPSFTLLLAPSELPRDASQVMRIFYATRQQLDSSGSTIPELHRDLIVLGAVAYALAAYQVPTNDNFEFEDGSLRDRVNDTSIPAAWLAVARSRMEQFEQRLNEIKLRRNFASSARLHWGDIPLRWGRL